MVIGGMAGRRRRDASCLSLYRLHDCMTMLQKQDSTFGPPYLKSFALDLLNLFADQERRPLPFDEKSHLNKYVSQ